MANNLEGAQPGPGAPYYPVPDYPATQPYGGLQAQPNPYPSLQPYGGLQPAYPPQAAPMSPPVIYADRPAEGFVDRPSTQQKKFPAYLFICLSVIIIVLSAIALELHEWMHSCESRISLTRVYADGFDKSLKSTKDLFCNSDYFYTPKKCGSVCSNLKDALTGGKTMQGLGITACISTALCILRMVLLLLSPRRCCKGLFLRIGMVLAAVFWVLGTLVYVGLYAKVRDNSSDSGVGPGLGLAIAVAVLQLINCGIGNLAVSKLDQ